LNRQQEVQKSRANFLNSIPWIAGTNYAVGSISKGGGGGRVEENIYKTFSTKKLIKIKINI